MVARSRLRTLAFRLGPRAHPHRAVSSLAVRGTITINADTTFLICDERGDVQPGAELGLYYEDRRYLSEYSLRLDGDAPRVLGAHAGAHDRASHFLANAALSARARGRLSLIRHRQLTVGMRETLELTNYGDELAEVALSLRFAADFAYIYRVKHELADDRDRSDRPEAASYNVDQSGRRLRFRADRDGAIFLLDVRLSRAGQWQDRCAHFSLRLPPRDPWALEIDFVPMDARLPTVTAPVATLPRGVARRDRGAQHAALAPTVHTDSYVLSGAYAQSVRDFVALRIKAEDISGGTSAIAAGIPWYMALFGRDSLIASYQALNFYPEVAVGSLVELAALQGSKVDPLREEQPGKILHEYRHSAPLAAGSVIPAFPYYGSVDATPLFLVTLAAYLRATGDVSLAQRLRANAERALRWMDTHATAEGYLVYLASTQGLGNQGWKDSADAVRFRDGRIATGPIALCEVQGYAYAARLGMAEIYDALDESAAAAAAQRKAAEQLRQRFEQDFWLEDRGFYAEALDGHHQRVDALTSNPGHLLWTGIASPEHARQVAQVLRSDAFFGGWGVRTMASSEGGYSPISYHNGTVWPHDNGLIIAGLARYGLVEEARLITDGLLAALAASPDARLPELFAGFGRDVADKPVDYPTACRPQAWAAGTIFHLLAVMAGFDPMPGAPTAGTRSFLPTDTRGIALDGVWSRGHRVHIELAQRADGTHVTRTPFPDPAP